jgi:hypothetical protein
MSAGAPKLLIADQSLRDFDGHHYEYDLAIAAAALRLGCAVVVGANAALKPGVGFPGAQLRPWFSRAWYESTKSGAARLAHRLLAALPTRLQGAGLWVGIAAKRLLARARPGLAVATHDTPFGDEILELAAAEAMGPGDHVLIHTLSVPEIDALAAAIMRAGNKPLPLFHLVLRRDPDETDVRHGQKGGITGVFALVRGTPQLAAQMRFYTDTTELAEEYARVALGLPVRVLPIPHCLPAPRPTPPSPRRALSIVYLGNARREKGFHLLPDLVDALSTQFLATGRARFIIQSNINTGIGEPGIAEAVRRLAAYPKAQVELLAAQMPVEAFQALVLSADVILLPYDRALYRRRSSGILVQALAAACPVIVPSRSWLAGQPAIGAALEFDTPADLVSAARRAIEEWPALKRAAKGGAEAWGGTVAATRFVALLLRG